MTLAATAFFIQDEMQSLHPQLFHPDLQIFERHTAAVPFSFQHFELSAGQIIDSFTCIAETASSGCAERDNHFSLTCQLIKKRIDDTGFHQIGKPTKITS